MAKQANVNELDYTQSPKVGFKIGTQSDANAIITRGSGATHGTFYLTEDTHRLYVGNHNGTLSSVNEGVKVYASVAAANLSAPTAAENGQFIYFQTENILAVASGAKWVQINPDTRVDSFNAAASAITGDALTALRTNASDNNIKEAVNVQYTIGQEEAGGGSVADKTDNIRIVTLSSNLHVTTDGTNIKLSCDAGDTYTLTSESFAGATSPSYIPSGVKVTVKNSSNVSVGDFIITGPTDKTNTIVPVLETVGNQKYIRLTGGGIDDIDFTVGTNTTDSSVLEINMVDGNNNESGKVQLKPVIVLHDNSQNTAVYDSTNHTLTTTLPVYTTSEIDAKMANAADKADAMHFAGTVGGTTQNPATYNALSDLKTAVETNVATAGGKNGATYKVTKDMTAPSSPSALNGITGGTEIRTGDLIILSGQEYQNTDSTNATTYTTNANLVGKLVPSTVVYNHIPSGDDFDEHHLIDFGSATEVSTTVNATNNTVTFTQNVSDSPAVHNLTFAAGRPSGATNPAASTTPPTVSSNVSTSGSTTTKTIYIDHAVIAAPTATAGDAINASGNLNYEPSFTIISGITTNNGHITGYTTRAINIKSKEIESITKSTTAMTGGYYIQDSVVLSGDSAVQSNRLEVTSSTLSITAPTAAYTAAQGEPATATLGIDLVWGQFTSAG